MAWIEYALAGFLGGWARAMYGLLKALNREEQVNRGHFIATLVVSTLTGALLGIVFDAELRIAALSGYVGTDILENLFVGSLPRSILVNKK